MEAAADGVARAVSRAEEAVAHLERIAQVAALAAEAPQTPAAAGAAQRAPSMRGPSASPPIVQALVRAGIVVSHRPHVLPAALEGLRGHGADQRVLAAWQAALEAEGVVEQAWQRRP